MSKTKPISIDDGAELSEFLVDYGSKGFLNNFLGDAVGELAGSVSAGKLALTIGRLFSNAKSHYRIKMLKGFLKAIESEEDSLVKFNSLSKGEQNDIRGLVLSQLDLQSDERQSEAMGFAVNAYLSKEMSRLTLLGIVSEIKNTNPLLYYFNVDNLGLDRLHTNFGKPVIKGPINLLPPAFYTNSMTEGSVGWSSVPGVAYVATDLGLAFFDYVYEPMALKYEV